ncbi:hypothetical protein [Sulfoacidibacillus ferrooxidans]|nr:hypothetical protein [Sulfoacidibacillus ferrooxidans]
MKDEEVELRCAKAGVSIQQQQDGEFRIMFPAKAYPPDGGYSVIAYSSKEIAWSDLFSKVKKGMNFSQIRNSTK